MKPLLSPGSFYRLIYSSHSRTSSTSFRTQCRFLSNTDKSKEQQTTPQDPKEEDKTGGDQDKKSFNYATGEIQDVLDKLSQKRTHSMSFEEAREAAQRMYQLQKRSLGDRWESIRNIFSGKEDQQRTPEEEWYYKRVSFWMQRYENFVGLTEVKASQARVVESEKRFVAMQEKRREVQAELAEVRKRLKDIHIELEKIHRGEDKYLALVTQEHQVLKDERHLVEQYQFYEKGERECFSLLSNAVRDSHEKERAQAEKTKYWSVLGSILGTCLGILGTTINNRLRMRELRQLVSQNSTVEEIQAIGTELSVAFSQHKNDLRDLTSEVVKILQLTKDSLDTFRVLDSILESLKESSEKINVRVLEESLSHLQKRHEHLNEFIHQHEKNLDEKFEGIRSDIFVQNTNVGKLAHIQLKDRERDQKLAQEREQLLRSTMDKLKTQHADFMQAMTNFGRDIEDKMKDIRSLLLVKHQMPNFEMQLVERLAAIEKKLDHATTTPPRVAAPVISGGAGISEENLVNILENYNNRTRQTIIMSTLVVALLTPIAYISFSQIF